MRSALRYKHAVPQCSASSTQYKRLCVSQVETSFGTKVMVCQSIMRSAKALQDAVMDDEYQEGDAGDMREVRCILAQNAHFGLHGCRS